MRKTPFTALVGCSIPIQQACLGGLNVVELAAEVTRAGALGTVDALVVPADVIATLPAPVCASFRVPHLDLELVAPAAEVARIVEFFYGDPDAELVALVHERGALASWQVGSADEAVAAEAAGCDYVTVQGIEAGGHVRGTQPRMEVLAETLPRVRVPVLAGGGIGTREDVRETLDAGAAGVRVGTRFVAAAESGAHPEYVAALIAERETVYTEDFAVGWPGAPHRVLRSALERARAAPEIVGQKSGRPISRFTASTPSAAETSGDIGAMSLWAGTSVHAVTRVQPAAEIVRELSMPTGA